MECRSLAKWFAQELFLCSTMDQMYTVPWMKKSQRVGNNEYALPQWKRLHHVLHQGQRYIDEENYKNGRMRQGKR